LLSQNFRSFFDEVLTTVENNRFLRAVQDSKTPINLDLRSGADSAMQTKIFEYGKHTSFNIKNALNLNLSLNWCFLKFLSSLQLLPSVSTYTPGPDATPVKRGKPQRYYFPPQVYVDGYGQIISRHTMPPKLVEKLQIDTTATPYTPIYQAFVAMKEKHKKIEHEVQQFEEELYSEGLEVAQRNEQSRNQAPALQFDKNNNSNTNPQHGQNNSNNINNDEKDEDVMNDESQLRISTATSLGSNASTLSYKKIGRILLRVINYSSQPPQYRYHSAVNLWNELFVLIYAYQDQIKVLYKRIMVFRDEQYDLRSSYARRLPLRLTRVYLNHDRQRRSRDQYVSPSMEFSKTPTTEADQKAEQGRAAAAAKKSSNEPNPPQKKINILARISTPSLFESLSSGSAGSTVPFESIPKAFTSVPIKSQHQIIAADPSLLLLAYLLADGVLHHLHKTIFDGVKAYDQLDLIRLEKITQMQQNQPPVETDGKNTLSSASRLGAFLTPNKQDPEEILKLQNEQVWLKRKALIIRLGPFDGYYSGQNQSPHLATAALQPLSTLQEEDEIPQQPKTPQKEKSPYNIFGGLEYIHANGPPHEDTLTQIYSTIQFSPNLFMPLVRCPILYPLLEPLLISPKLTTSSTSAVTKTDPASLSKAETATAGTESSSSPNATQPTTELTNVSGQNETNTPTNNSIPTTTTTATPARNNTPTSFIDSQYYIFWVKLQDYLENPWSLDDHFNQFRILGRGAFGTVTGVQHTRLLSVYAVKEISKRMVHASEKGYHFMVMNERRMLKAVHSQFVLHLHASLHDREKLYLFTDICLGGDLSYHLKQQATRRFHYARARFYAAQIILGLEHMHAKSIVYRDLKPSNILLDSDGNAKISDLGLSLRLPKSGSVLRHVAGTAGYWAPEVVSKSGTFVTSDYWSLGVMLYEMLCGHRPKLRSEIYAKRGKELIKDKSRGKKDGRKAANTPGGSHPKGGGGGGGDDDDGRQSFSMNSKVLDSNANLSQDGSHSELRSSQHNLQGLGISIGIVSTGALADGVLESVVYQKFDHKLQKAFVEYQDALKPQLQQLLSPHKANTTLMTPKASQSDLANIASERINYSNSALFTPQGAIIQPFQTQFTPQRFILLPVSLNSAKKPSIINANLLPGGVQLSPMNHSATPGSGFSERSAGDKISKNSSNGSLTPLNMTPSHSNDDNGFPHGLSNVSNTSAANVPVIHASLDYQPLGMNATPKQRQGRHTRTPSHGGARHRADSNASTSHLRGENRNHGDNNNNNNNNGNNGENGQDHQIGLKTDEYGNKKEELGSIQSQVLDLLKDDGQDDDNDDRKPTKGNKNALEDDDDGDDDGGGGSGGGGDGDNKPTNLDTDSKKGNNVPDGLSLPDYDPSSSQQPEQRSPTGSSRQTQPATTRQATSSSAQTTAQKTAENATNNPIPSDIMANFLIKSALYDKTSKSPLNLTSFGDKYIISDPKSKVVRDFRVISSTDDNCIAGTEIEKALELVNNPLRWSPFDQSQKTETQSRIPGSLLDVDVDYNIDAAFLTLNAVDLFIRLFDPDPSTRLGAGGVQEIKNHPFFTSSIEGFGSINWDLLSQQLIVPPYKPEANIVHAKSMDELANSPQEQKFKNVKLTPEIEQQYSKWYHTDPEHREKELVKILTNNVEIEQYLWGNSEKKEKLGGESKACCEIM
jgi:serine/threonine protein kinase